MAAARWADKLDDVACYNYALSADAVQLHYGGDTTAYGYDSLSGLTSVKYPDAPADSYTYERRRGCSFHLRATTLILEGSRDS